MAEYEVHVNERLDLDCGVAAANIAPPNTAGGSRVEMWKTQYSKWCTWTLWKCLLLGQLLSLLICGTAVTSQMLHSDYNISVPTAQSFLNYVLLCAVYTTWLACRSGERGLLSVLRKRGWKYFILAAIDVEANYLVVKAYHHTTLTSVQLLDCFTIPIVLLLSWLVLKVRYRLIHIIGVSICLVGVGCLVWADIQAGRPQGNGYNKLLGDSLCLAGATLYGVSNVAEEYVVKTYNRVEFLGMIGLFGSVLNGIQLSVLEREEVTMIKWDDVFIVLLLVGFALCLFLLYSIMPVVLKHTSAAAVNLSILSADFYTLLFGLFLFHFKFHFLYFLAFVLVIVGIIVYSLRPTPSTVRHLAGGSPDYREMINENVAADVVVADVELGNHANQQSTAPAVHGNGPVA